ncbi:MAG: hypothetical protein OQK24_01005 [Magnetovibrio sp.]|nr:hypothetical protein [Magnetovibrio sp.]
MYLKSDAQERALIEAAIQEAEETRNTGFFKGFANLKAWYIKTAEPMKAALTRENVRGMGHTSKADGIL